MFSCPQIFAHSGFADVQWWDLVPAALGAILGAGAGAVPAFILAKRSSKDVLDRDIAARKAAQRDAAFRTMVKLNELVNEAAGTHRQVEANIAAHPDDAINNGQLWPKMQGLAGLLERQIYFEADELAVTFAAGAPKLANDLSLLAIRIATDVISLREYASARNELGLMMGVSSVEGQVGTTVISREELAKIMPQILHVESLAQQIRPSLKENSDAAVIIQKRFSKKMQEFFSEPKFLEIDFADGVHSFPSEAD